MKNYSKTLRACYLGLITQAIAANFAPLLFWSFHSDFNISLGQIALIPAVFYVTQLVVDLICAKYVDAIGYRKSIVASQLLAGLGLIGIAVLPNIVSPYIGILIGVFFYAFGSGLIEVLCSPIVEACPFEHKEKVMSLLHSFYCWGSVGVILLSTLYFAIFGIDQWQILACVWAIIPLYNIYNFATCPIERLVEDGQGMSLCQLLKKPIFAAAIILMICAGASEMSMAQWASAFAESALGLTKSVGDLAGDNGNFAYAVWQIRRKDRFDKVYAYIGRYLRRELSFGRSICNADLGLSWLCHVRLLSGYYVARKHQHHCSEDSQRRYGAVCAAGNGRGHGRRIWAECGGIFFAACRR